MSPGINANTPQPRRKKAPRIEITPKNIQKEKRGTLRGMRPQPPESRSTFANAKKPASENYVVKRFRLPEIPVLIQISTLSGVPLPNGNACGVGMFFFVVPQRFAAGRYNEICQQGESEARFIFPNGAGSRPDTGSSSRPRPYPSERAIGQSPISRNRTPAPLPQTKPCTAN